MISVTRSLRIMLITLTAAAILAGASMSWAAYPETITTTTPFTNLTRPSDDPRWAQAFKHWNKRADDNEVLAAVALFEELARDKPGCFDAQLWLARSYYLSAFRERGEDALARHSKALAAVDKALKIEPENEAALYWRYCIIQYLRDYTKPELEHIRTMGMKHINTRELVVPDNDPLWQQAVTHFDNRYQRQDALKAISIFKQLKKKYPGRIEPLLWLARSNYWMHYIEEESDDKAKWLIIARDYGREAIEIEPRNAAASWWTATSLGQWASHTSAFNFVRVTPEVMRLLQLVMEEDPNYYYGGASQYLAMAIAKAGVVAEKGMQLFGFSEEQTMRAVNFAYTYAPMYLRNHFALALMYVSQDKLDLAKPHIDYVLAADPAELKLQEPENLICIELTRELYEKEFK